MPRIALEGVGVEFRVRAAAPVTLKEFLLRRAFRRNRAADRTVHALRSVDFAVADGDRVGVVGHNGAGKSTLLKLIAGIYPPSAGVRSVEGRICSLFDITLGFEEEANGWDNIRYRSYLQGQHPREVAAKMPAIAEFSELGEFLDAPLRVYSAGMRLRLAFAIATAAEPEVLLVDEVLAVGDLAFQRKARLRMQELMRSSRVMVMVSHDLDALPDFCDRTVWLDRGTIVADGRTGDVVARYRGEAATRPGGHLAAA